MVWKIFFKTAILFAAVCIFGQLYGQKYRVIYSMKFKPDSTATEYTTKNMLLDIDGSNSRFYSYKVFQSDSTYISNDRLGRETMRKSLDYEFMVIKKKSQNKIAKFYKGLIDIYEMKEDFPNLQWQIYNTVKMIGDNKCQKASLDYKGRKWEAWFAIDIPISDGPYVFSGLPGLIISMSDASGSYSFDLTSLKKNEENLYTSNHLSLKAVPITLKQLHKLYLDFYNDPYKEVKSGHVKMKVVDQDGKEITPNFYELTKIKQESLRKANNPVELSEAIQYPD
ncbi:GLPGLI family protein [Chryseobacterium vrystaatense]|uniref:GLPGLI family protein n=1 Tax=Chryseobacterium vrystaatense TaxID=307480 RepID=A0A1M4WYM8_9FLAO|nr:GLPGLI family protein [Chryseobacterium vrystaatense]SHE86300.1 GLPGLI family protein [Chryseobacterium vrystaatense]